MRSRVSRRPSAATCSECGERIHLSRCGVEEHLRTRTPRERAEGRCPGRVYIHESNGGIECPPQEGANRC